MIEGCSKTYEGKSLFLAVVLNLYLPSLGYLYLGKKVWLSKWKISTIVIIADLFLYSFLSLPESSLNKDSSVIIMIFSLITIVYILGHCYLIFNIWTVSTDGNPNKLKNPIIAIVMNIYFPSSAYLYINIKDFKKFIKMFSFVALGIILLLFLGVPQVGAMMFCIMQIFTTYDSYSTLKKYNSYIISNGTKPHVA
jgi:hypothetical protein